IEVVATILPCKIKTKFPGHDFKIVYMNFCSKRFSRMRADRLLAFGPLHSVYVGAKLGGTLKNMKELSERKPHQPKYNGNRMGNRHELVCPPFKERVVIRNPQSCHGDRDQQDQRQPVALKRLRRDEAAMRQPAPQHNYRTDDDQPGAPYEHVKNDECHWRPQVKARHGKTESIRDVAGIRTFRKGKMNPTESKRNGYRKGQQASCRQGEVTNPSCPAAGIDKTLEEDVAKKKKQRPSQVWKKISAEQELP